MIKMEKGFGIMTQLEILTTTPYNFSNNEANELIKKMEAMSLQEKIGQLFFLMHSDMYPKEIIEGMLTKIKPGGLMYRPTSEKTILAIKAFCEKELSIQPFFSANLESGANALLNDQSGYGSAMLLSATNDLDLVENAVNDVAKTAASTGINMTFSPVVDLQINPNNPVTGTRSFGDQVDQVAAMSAKCVDVFSDNDILPVVKHFPGDGVDDRDHHLLPSVNSLSLDEWHQSYGAVYRQLIEQEVPCIMAGHILLPAYDRSVTPTIADNDLRPATLSKSLLQGLLRGELNFNGLIITDASNMGGFNSFYPRSQAVVETINAGCDMLLFTKDLEEDYQSIYAAVAAGIISPTRLEEAVTRILGTKALLEKNKHPKQEGLTIEQQQQLKEQVADKGITLVKNAIDFHRLDIEKDKKILLLPLGNELKASQQIEKTLVNEGFNVMTADSKDLQFGIEMMMSSSAKTIERYDVILYVLDYQGKSNQTTNRVEFGLPMGQFMPAMVKEIPTIMLSFGNPYHLLDAPRVPVYINAYSNQSEVVAATIEKLLGRSPFKGVSPVDAFCGRFDTKCY